MKVRVKLTPGQESLNPYYTGIHLHMTQLICVPRHICLNPYYTGIHLHTKRHSLWFLEICVLILIILEYIYIELA